MSMDVGLLILRVVIGSLFVAHGTQKLFGWFGGHGLDGTGGFFESIGYRPGRSHAAVAGAVEATAGLLLVVGLFTPLASAAIIGLMLNAIVAVHWPRLWSTEGGIEYPLVAAATAACLAFTGAGVASLDHAVGLDLDGPLWGFLGLFLGVIVGGILLAVRETHLIDELLDETVEGVAYDDEYDDDDVYGEAEVSSDAAADYEATTGSEAGGRGARWP